jgi:hypothetical protein
MNLLDILREDYARFPKDQTYSIYASDVLFKDPVNEFWGVDRYQKMIRFIDTWFIDPTLDVHHMEQRDRQIETRWTLSWTAPLPWKPRMSIAGWSELELNSDGLIVSHIDHWHDSKLNVLKQVFRRGY